MASPIAPVNEYEAERERRIAENNVHLELARQKLAELKALTPVPPPKPPRAIPQKRPRSEGSLEPQRKSVRQRSMPTPIYLEAEAPARTKLRTLKVKRSSMGMSRGESGLAGWKLYECSPQAQHKACRVAQLKAEELGPRAFVVRMQTSHCSGGFWLQMTRPIPSASGIRQKTSIRLRCDDMRARGPDGFRYSCDRANGGPANEWPVVWLPREKESSASAGLSGGWRGFAIDQLVTGNDTLIFQLDPAVAPGSPISVIIVHIFRAMDYEPPERQMSLRALYDRPRDGTFADVEADADAEPRPVKRAKGISAGVPSASPPAGAPTPGAPIGAVKSVRPPKGPSAILDGVRPTKAAAEPREVTAKAIKAAVVRGRGAHPPCVTMGTALKEVRAQTSKAVKANVTSGRTQGAPGKGCALRSLRPRPSSAAQNRTPQSAGAGAPAQITPHTTWPANMPRGPCAAAAKALCAATPDAVTGPATTASAHRAKPGAKGLPPASAKACPPASAAKQNPPQVTRPGKVGPQIGARLGFVARKTPTQVTTSTKGATVKPPRQFVAKNGVKKALLKSSAGKAGVGGAEPGRGPKDAAGGTKSRKTATEEALSKKSFAPLEGRPAHRAIARVSCEWAIMKFAGGVPKGLHIVPRLAVEC